jgi:hypothetical protein
MVLGQPHPFSRRFDASSYFFEMSAGALQEIGRPGAVRQVAKPIKVETLFVPFGSDLCLELGVPRFEASEFFFQLSAAFRAFELFGIWLWRPAFQFVRARQNFHSLPPNLGFPCATGARNSRMYAPRSAPASTLILGSLGRGLPFNARATISLAVPVLS